MKKDVLEINDWKEFVEELRDRVNPLEVRTVHKWSRRGPGFPLRLNLYAIYTVRLENCIIRSVQSELDIEAFTPEATKAARAKFRERTKKLEEELRALHLSIYGGEWNPDEVI